MYQNFQKSLSIFFNIFLVIIFREALNSLHNIFGSILFFLGLLIILNLIRTAHGMIVINTDPVFDNEIFQNEKFSISYTALHFILQILLLLLLHYFIKSALLKNPENNLIPCQIFYIFISFSLLYFLWDLLILDVIKNIDINKEKKFKNKKELNKKPYNIKSLVQNWLAGDFILLLITIIIFYVNYFPKISFSKFDITIMLRIKKWADVKPFYIILYFLSLMVIILSDYIVNRKYYFGKR